jgi:tight adherence protein C
VTDQMRIGIAMDEAMWGSARRLAIPEFNFLVISLAIQQETGGNLAEIMEKLSDMVRRREQMRLKVKAMSSEARASAMIIGSLPFIMAGVISFVNPDYMNTLFTDPPRLGHDRRRPDQPADRRRCHVQNDQVRRMNELDQVLPFGLTADGLLVTLFAAMAFLSVWAVWYALLEKHPMERRARMLTARRNELRGQLLKDKGARARQKEGLSVMRQVVAALKLMQTQQTDKLHDHLAQAGLRSRDAVIVFLFFKVAMPVLLAALTFMLVYLLEVGDLSPGSKLLALLGGAVLGFFVPELYVSNQVKKRQLALSKALPDGLDLLVICAESGLSLDAALDRVANEIGGASAALAEELSLTSIELGFLPERRQALLNLNRRTNLPAIRGVVNTLLQTEKYGTPLSQSLRVLANEFRDQRLLKAEEKAARLPATLTVPMIVFILPVLFIVLVGPAIINVMDTLGR